MSVHDVLDGVVHQVVQYLGCDSCFLYVKDGDELVLCATHDRPVSDLGNIRLRLSEGLTGWVARERRLLALPREAFKDPRFKTFTNLPEDSYEAFLSAPVICLNRVLGVVNVQYRQTHDHTGDDMEFLTTIGELLGCYLMLTLIEPSLVEGAHLVNSVMTNSSRPGNGNGQATGAVRASEASS
ncbi:MAG: GAF domain-containing protein [Bryobacterales bacterium]|nr:GAF domain-containing protein [Bryobacterales bacterium]